jgi:glycosyltransferase involved in cell wall biosynthesis
MGIPTISGDVGGIKECVDNGATGFVLQDKLPASYADKAIQLLSDDALRNTMGEKQKIKVKSDFTMEKVIGKYNSFFEKMSKS